RRGTVRVDGAVDRDTGRRDVCRSERRGGGQTGPAALSRRKAKSEGAGDRGGDGCKTTWHKISKRALVRGIRRQYQFKFHGGYNTWPIHRPSMIEKKLFCVDQSPDDV